MTAGESRWAARITGGLRPLQQYVCSRQTLAEPLGLRVLAQIFFQLVLALVQGLQTQFPAMELNAQLVDVAGYFRPLRFILLQFPLQVREFLRRRRADGHWHHWDDRWFAAALAVQCHSGGGGVNNERTGAVLTLEKEIAMFAFCLGTNRVHHSLLKQRLYQRRGHPHGCRWGQWHLAR